MMHAHGNTFSKTEAYEEGIAHKMSQEREWQQPNQTKGLMSENKLKLRSTFSQLQFFTPNQQKGLKISTASESEVVQTDSFCSTMNRRFMGNGDIPGEQDTQSYTTAPGKSEQNA